MRKLLMVSCLLSAAFLPSRAGADWVDRWGDFKLVKLAHLRANANAYIHQTVRVRVIFYQLGNIYNPAYTRFTPDAYVNFYAWSYESKLWLRKDLLGFYGYFFMRKDSEEQMTLLKIKKYQALEMLCRIHDRFENEPWIDVLHVTRVQGTLDKKTIHGLHQGLVHLGKKEYDGAIHHIKSALVSDVPRSYRAKFQRLLALIYYFEKKWYFPAEVELAKAIALNPKDRFLEYLHLKVKARNDTQRLRIETGWKPKKAPSIHEKAPVPARGSSLGPKKGGGSGKKEPAKKG